MQEVKPKKLIMDRFSEYLQKSFEGFCARHGLEQNDQHLLTYLIDQDLIAHRVLNQFTIRKEYEKLCAEFSLPKTLIVDTIANRFNISERTVWSALKNTKNRPPREA